MSAVETLIITNVKFARLSVRLLVAITCILIILIVFIITLLVNAGDIFSFADLPLGFDTQE
jgi:hypothetical protein